MSNVLLLGIGLVFILAFIYEFIADNVETVPFSIQGDLIKTELPVKWVLLAIGAGLFLWGLS